MRKRGGKWHKLVVGNGGFAGDGYENGKGKGRVGREVACAHDGRGVRGALEVQGEVGVGPRPCCTREEGLMFAGS
jgi:hypothetical protein